MSQRTSIIMLIVVLLLTVGNVHSETNEIVTIAQNDTAKVVIVIAEDATEEVAVCDRVIYS